MAWSTRAACAAREGGVGVWPAAAAIVNVADLRRKTPPPGFSGELALSAISHSGNTEKSSVSAGTHLDWHEDGRTGILALN